MKSYEYNGTIAPMIPTFYGMFDRYYSFYKKYPWNLPKNWTEVDNLNLSTLTILFQHMILLVVILEAQSLIKMVKLLVSLLMEI